MTLSLAPQPTTGLASERASRRAGDPERLRPICRCERPAAIRFLLASGWHDARNRFVAWHDKDPGRRVPYRRTLEITGHRLDAEVEDPVEIFTRGEVAAARPGGVAGHSALLASGGFGAIDMLSQSCGNRHRYPVILSGKAVRQPSEEAGHDRPEAASHLGG
jgi:hypothetical protein